MENWKDLGLLKSGKNVQYLQHVKHLHNIKRSFLLRERKGCIRSSVARQSREVMPLLLSALSGHIWSAGSSSGFPSKRDTYWRQSSKGQVKILSCEEKLREQGLFSLEKNRLREISSMHTNIWRDDVKKREPGSFLWCPGTGEEAMGTNWNTGGSI